jgi:signal transduction histidine kinase
VTTVGALTAAIAHEIKQPIAATVTNASAGMRWLAAQPPDLEEARQAFGRIVRDGNRAAEVIGRIRALVKKVPPCRERLDINQVVLEVISMIQGELHRNRVQLQTALARDLPEVPGDRVQLQQMILNLILNAVDAMSGVADRPRELVVGSGASDSDVFVEVRDSGSGLDAANLDRLFDSFYTTKPNGMGMGLSISRSIVEAHGGRLVATQNAPHGAVFRFTLLTCGREVSTSGSSAAEQRSADASG